ncbi:MAG: argininosuccinate synthase, partial [Phycisphaerae bacterium]
KVVLAYSGGLDTSVILPWIRETYGCEVIAFVCDIGQGPEELRGIAAKARASGASKCIIRDCRKAFVQQFLWPLLKSGAVYEHRYLLGTSVARPLIAREQVRVAQAERADAVAHGATGKGNDQVRFETTYMALDPTLKIIAPWKDRRFREQIHSREAALAYARARGIAVEAATKGIYSRDRNLWHLSHEGAELESTWNEPKDRMLLLSAPIERAASRPEYVQLGFEQGVPISLDGRRMDGVRLINRLNEIGGRHGVGQADLVENRLVGMKSRGVYETPGGTILYEAHRALEAICLDRETLHFKQQVALRYAELVYDGRWFTPLREAIDAFIDRTQQTVSGQVRVKLYRGNCLAVGARSPQSLYVEKLASFTMGAEYDPADAEGFIRLFGLPMRVAGAVARRNKKAKGK